MENLSLCMNVWNVGIGLGLGWGGKHLWLLGHCKMNAESPGDGLRHEHCLLSRVPVVVLRWVSEVNRKLSWIWTDMLG